MSMPVNTQGIRYITGTATGTVRTGLTKVWGVQICAAATACTVEFKDGGASGTSKWKMAIAPITAGTNVVDCCLWGLEFKTSLYVAMSNHAVVNIQYE